ncbi:MAG: tetratricopeptide repeat protein [Saprospiraceae bacterium]|nr:tetratricopeptide repeat protein [Saprospiraceae bacterium]
MAKRKTTKKKQDDTLVDLVEARNNAQSFIDGNRNLLFGGLTVLVVAIGGIFFYNNFVKKPKAAEAVNKVWGAEQQFFQDSFAMALANPGGSFQGLKDIVDQYGSTPTGNVATFYTGISYLRLGEYQNAIDYIEDVDDDGQIMPIVKYGVLGDAYSELGDFGKAMSNYKKAVSNGDNEALTPIYLMKVGMLNEKEGKFAEALAAYKQIKSKYPTSAQGREVEKYLIRLEGRG